MNISNLDDPASDYTPVLLQINAKANTRTNPYSISQGRVNWKTFRNLMSMNSFLNIKLKTPADIDSSLSSSHGSSCKAHLPYRNFKFHKKAEE